ncbi:MAG: TraR/DksA C4-type zinc finger protein [bacterium]|nr:TraR/DksA C4-type zinc finger protein [bacterium]
MQIPVQKSKLESGKAKLLKQLDHYKKEDPYLIPDRQSSNTVDDDITEIEGHDRITATRIALETDLKAVEEALGRIKDGTYGNCQNCGKKIEENRLSIMTTAKFCLDCQEKRK